MQCNTAWSRFSLACRFEYVFLRLCYGTGARQQAGAVRPARWTDWTDGGRARFRALPLQNGFPGIPVKAWIRFPNCAELVDGEVYVWTAKAVEVTWQDGPVTYRTWVWSSAVTRREELMNRNLGERTNRDSDSK
jgi:hypothetical protein